jgi:hypothetical protein
MSIALVVAPSATKLPPETDGAVLISGSHGAIYAAYLSVKAGARAAIHHDAGIGRDKAGVSGLDWAEAHGMAMAAVSTESARIGDGADMLRRGIISRANPLAAACGVVAGQSVAIAVDLLKAAPWPHARPDALAEGRVLVGKIVCLDSMSLGTACDADRVVASGSHGGVLAGETAAAFRPLLALFNDAGFGADRAGAAGLQVLDKAGIAALTVAALSARIGDGRSTLRHGVISEANESACRLGARIGGSALALAHAVTEKAP